MTTRVTAPPERSLPDDPLAYRAMRPGTPRLLDVSCECDWQDAI